MIRSTFLRQLVRQFVRAPSFTTVSVITLALGIGSTTAMFAVVDGVLLEPLPYEAPDRLVGLWHEAPGLDLEDVNQSPALYLTYRAESRVFEDIGMWAAGRAAITGLGEPERIEVMRVTDGTLRLLGVRAARGRIFTREDDAAGAALTAVLSWGYWQTRLGSDPAAIGRTITVNGEPREIVGVLPRGFRLLDQDASIYLPLQFDPAEVILGNFSYQGLGRLKPGVTTAQADADLARLIPIAAERFPRGMTLQMLTEARFAPDVRPLSAEVIGDVGKVLWMLLGTVGIVLLVAGANVANLFLVRAEGRYREVAVRTALGASRARIAREFFAESIALALIGGMLGLGMAAAAVRVLKAVGPEQLPRLQDIAIDGTVLAVAFGLSVLVGALLGLVPVLRHSGEAITAGLRDGGRGGSTGRERHRARNTLVVAQLALALVLLAGSGLLVRSAQALRNVDPGFERPGDVLSFRLSIPQAEVSEPAAVLATHRRIMQEVEAIPGVAAVALTSAQPMEGYSSSDPIDPEEFPAPPGQLAPIRRYKWLSPGWFATLGTPLLAGRDFTWNDMQTRVPIVIVSESLAREYWDSPQDAIGKRVRNVEGRPWREIVGVAADVREDGVDQDPPPIAYWPMLVADVWEDGVDVQRTMAYTLRLERELTPALTDAVRRAVWAVNPNLPLADVTTLEQLFDRSRARTSFTLVMLSIAAAVALLLGAIGLYGVTSYAVAQRTREFGVRMALGARSSDVGGLVLRQAAVLIAIGVVAGLLVSLAATRLMTALLFGVAPADPITFIAVALLMGVVATVASLVPVRRATRVDPLEALRSE
ncbi:MAG TPA: ABC transporter permease [Longimicrobiales bacterium]|nr:ABC transporter permease [Longimicrobiales bacterium]